MVYSVIAVIFNVFLTFLFTCSAVCAFIIFRMKKLPEFGAMMAVFLSYMIDNAIVFCTEIIPAFADIYDRLFLETPSIKTVCFIVRISGMLYLLNRIMPAFGMKAVLFCSALHAFSLICAPLIPRPDWMVYTYYFFSQFIIISVCLWALIRIKRTKECYTLSEYKHLKHIFIYFLLMTTFVLAEDTYVIFFVDVYTTTGLNIFNRNLSENLLFIGFAIALIFYTIRFLDELKLSQTDRSEVLCTDVSEKTDPVICFANNFNLTERELEILRCVLDGKTQQEISEMLVIALGTVKTHTHNIYIKAGAANRAQVIMKYREFLRINNEDPVH